MKTKISLLVLSFLFSLQTFSQAPNCLWAQSIGGTTVGWVGSSVALDASGNIYTTGNFSGTADFDPGPGVFNLTATGSGMFISKLDASGNFVWAKTMGGAGDPAGTS